MEAHLKDQHIAASKKLSDERQKIPNLLQILLFEDIVKKVSSYALRKAHEQYLQFQRSYQFWQELPACTKYHNHALGIPCAHDFFSRLPRVEQQAEEPTTKKRIPELPALKMTDFNPHWWLQVSTVHPIIVDPRQSNLNVENIGTFTQQQEDIPAEVPRNQAILEQGLADIQTQFGHLPVHQKVAVLNQVMGIASGDPSALRTVLELLKKKRGRGRPPGSKNKKVRRDENSTRCDPSAFEHAIARSTGSIIRSRCCTKCKMPGHNKHSCTSVPEEIKDADNTGTEVDEDDYEEYYDATEHTPLPETLLPEAPSPEAPSSKASLPKAPLSAQGKKFEGVPHNVRQIPATPTAVRVRSILEQLDNLDDNDPAFIRDDGSTNFFLEHGWGIGDPAN